MRIRRKPDAIPRLLAHPLVKNEPRDAKGNWRSYFPNSDNPLYVELGTGKGKFLAEASSKYPDVNWIGIEKIQEPLLQAVEKGEATGNSNLLYIWMDIQNLRDIFAPHEVDRIYLHFSDPWPKKRHAKRRLTHRNFLSIYQEILAPDGDLILKTDSISLFEFSLEEFRENGWVIQDLTRDLHASPWNAENIRTEYEEKFSSKGMPIYFVRVTPPIKEENIDIST
jgi:tRNA (guanine-N7-)-methyltransferase